MFVELGCGKGGFISQKAFLHPENNYLAIDLVDPMLGLAKRKVEGIYINFCNPWPRGKHHKKRLTYTRQLEHYKQFLKPDGKIYFKTDDDNLFEESIHYFEDAGFEIEKITRNLQSEPDFWENIETEHERMFSEQGIKIKACQLKNCSQTDI